MSLLTSTAIANMQLKLRTIGQKVSDADFFLALNSANSYFFSTYKMPTAEREADLLLFTGVYEYPLPSDYRAIIEPKRSYDTFSPRFQHTTSNSLIHYLRGNRTAIKHIRETAYLQVNYLEGSSSSIHNGDTLDENGTWSISGDGSSIAQDKQTYYAGTASLRFTITGSGGTTTLVNSTMTQVDITDYLLHYLFLDLGCPSGNTTAITSVRVRIGSDASNYYQVTNTTRYRGDTISAGHGLIGFDLSGKSTTGTPDDDALDYIQILITNPTDGTVNGTYHLDNIFFAQANYFELPYYSKNNVKGSDNVYQELVDAVDDTILCPLEAVEAYQFKALEQLAVWKLQDEGLANYFRGELKPHENSLKSKYPRQDSLIQTNWYRKGNRF